MDDARKFSFFILPRQKVPAGLPLLGRRIAVRPFNLADEACRQHWRKFDNRYLSRFNFAPRRALENRFLFERLRDRIRLALDGPNGDLIGYASLKVMAPQSDVAEIGLCFAADWIGRGYGREALELILPWAIEFLKLKKIVLDVDDINQRAVRLYRRLGFAVSGRFWRSESDLSLADYARRLGLEQACRRKSGGIEILVWRMEWSPTRPG